MTITTSTTIGDTTERLLADAIGCRQSERAAAAELLDLAARWADLHPAGSRDSAATFTCRGDDTQVPISAGTGRLVDAMAVAEFGVYLHLAAEALTDTSGSHCAGRVGNTQNPVHVDRVRGWLSAPNTHITIRPVIDVSQPMTVDGYEIPDRIREQVDPAEPDVCVPVVHPPRRTLRPGPHRQVPVRRDPRPDQHRQPGAAVPTPSPVEDVRRLALPGA